MKKCFVAISLAFVFGAPEFAQEKLLTKAEIAEVRRKCKVKLISQAELQQPENCLGKDEKYVGSPVVSFRIAADGTVHDVKLKRSSGAQKLDACVVRNVVRWKYKPLSAWEGIETTMGILIHFERSNLFPTKQKH